MLEWCGPHHLGPYPTPVCPAFLDHIECTSSLDVQRLGLLLVNILIPLLFSPEIYPKQFGRFETRTLVEWCDLYFVRGGFDADGDPFEGKGISPDVHVEFPDEPKYHDLLLNVVLELLKDGKK